MKKSNLRLLAFVLFLVLAQNSIAATHQDGTGSEAASDETVAVGLSYTDGSGTVHKNIAGNPAEPLKKYYASAIGIANKASGEGSSAFGFTNEASGVYSSAFGSQYKVTGNYSGAFGVGKKNGDNYKYINEGKNSYMFGNYNKIAGGTENNFILGNNVSIGSGINNSVALGNNSTVSSSNEVSVGSGTLKRKIVNVGDGEISNSSTDAVNGR